MRTDSTVGNAADADQVRNARRKERDQRIQELNDLRALLALPEFRRFMWRVIGFCKVFGSIFEASARIYHNSGKQDVGHFLMSEITEAQPESFLQMIH